MAYHTTENRLQFLPEDMQAVPIDRLNIDVFTLILQKVIDDEADGFMVYRLRLVHKPKAAMTLALVCKKWKDFIYSTPSFWPIINFSTFNSVDQVQEKLDRLTKRAINAPVDLVISDIHSDDDLDGISTKGHSDDCCCRLGTTNFRLNLSNIVNVRRFRVEFMRPSGFKFLDPIAFPFLKTIKQFQFCVWQIPNENHPRFNMDTFLSKTPRIEDLYLNIMRVHYISNALLNKQFMPNLRTLTLGGAAWNNPDELPKLVRFLSHAPKLEALEILGFDFNNYTSTPVRLPNSLEILPYLRKIHTEGFIAVNWLFNSNGIKIPHLQEISYSEWSINDDYDDCEKFFSTHQSITKISFWTGDQCLYDKRLRWVPKVEELTIRRREPGEWLSPLYTPRVDENTGLPSYICPNIRILTINTPSESLSTSIFEELVRVRCLPVDQRGFTEAGCKAVEFLRLERLRFRGENSPLFDTDAWKKAKVWKVPDNKYELEWSYHLCWPYQTG